MAAPDWSFARRPTWLVGHVVALVGIVVFVSLSFWQFDRLDERRELNALVTARLEASPAPVLELIAEHESSDALAFRRATAVGEYLPAGEVLYLLVSRNGQSGHTLLTPLRLEGSDEVLMVERGWVPADAEGPPVPDAEPPVGSVTVTGALLDIADRTRDAGSVDANTRRITTFDRAALGAFVGAEVLPTILRLEASDPAGGPSPALMPGPVLSEGPHLGYAVQWLLFAGVVLVGYPILLWRTSLRRPGRAEDASRS